MIAGGTERQELCRVIGQRSIMTLDWPGIYDLLARLPPYQCHQVVGWHGGKVGSTQDTATALARLFTGEAQAPETAPEKEKQNLPHRRQRRHHCNHDCFSYLLPVTCYFETTLSSHNQNMLTMILSKMAQPEMGGCRSHCPLIHQCLPKVWL